jgi:hypothetical protein
MGNMFAQKITQSVHPSIPADSLLAIYLKGQEQTDAFHNGDVLAAAVADLLPRLPAGPVALLATSTAGAGLAAACAAQRTEPTTWVSVDLRLPAKEIEDKAVVVDPIDAGAGWRNALLRVYPDAQFVTAKPGTAHLELAA